MIIMIGQFVKDEGIPVVCVATSTCRYDTERRSRRVKQFVSYGFASIITLLLYSQKSFLRPVLACVASHRSRQKKPLHFAN